LLESSKITVAPPPHYVSPAGVHGPPPSTQPTTRRRTINREVAGDSDNISTNSNSNDSDDSDRDDSSKKDDISSVWKSSPGTAKRPRPDWTVTD
jgi:hypothetical protein